jgi:hypothetical protein
MSLVTRVYYMIVPNQVITQDQIQAQLKVCLVFYFFIQINFR